MYKKFLKRTFEGPASTYIWIVETAPFLILLNKAYQKKLKLPSEQVSEQISQYILGICPMCGRQMTMNELIALSQRQILQGSREITCVNPSCESLDFIIFWKYQEDTVAQKRIDRLATKVPPKPEVSAEPYEEWAKYHNEELGFSVAHPSDWERDFTSGQLVIYPGDYQSVSSQSGIIRSPAISVRVDSLKPTSPAHQMSPSQFYHQFLADQHKFFQGYKRLWEQALTLTSGEEAMLWSFDFNQNDNAFRAIFILVLKAGNIYFVDGSCLQTQASLYEGTLKNSRKSNIF